MLHVVGSYCQHGRNKSTIRIKLLKYFYFFTFTLLIRKGGNHRADSIRIKLKSFEKVASSLFTIRSLDNHRADSIRIKLKSFEKVASSLFTIRSLDSPHECYQDFYTGCLSFGCPLSIPTTLEPECYHGKT